MVRLGLGLILGLVWLGLCIISGWSTPWAGPGRILKAPFRCRHHKKQTRIAMHVRTRLWGPTGQQLQLIIGIMHNGFPRIQG